MSWAEGSLGNTRKARGKREKASKTTASLKDTMRKREATSVHEPQDAEAGFGRVVRALSVREPVPTGSVDVEGFLVERGVERLFMKLGPQGLRRITLFTHLGEALSEDEPEQMGGLHQRAQRELVEAAAFDEREKDAVAVGHGIGQDGLRRPSGAGLVQRRCAQWRQVSHTAAAGFTRQLCRRRRQHARGDGPAAESA